MIYKDGKILIPCEYTDWSELYNGIYIVEKNKDKKGLIKDGGEIVLPIEYDYISTNTNQNMIAIKKNGKQGFLSSDFKIAIPCIYEKVWAFGEKVALAPIKIKGKMGYVNVKGELVVPAIYASVGLFGKYDGAWARQGFKLDLINKNGKVEKTDPIEFTVIKNLKNGNSIILDKETKKYGIANIKTKTFIRYFEITQIQLTRASGNIKQNDNLLTYSVDKKSETNPNWGCINTITGKVVLFANYKLVKVYDDFIFVCNNSSRDEAVNDEGLFYANGKEIIEPEYSVFHIGGKWYANQKYNDGSVKKYFLNENYRLEEREGEIADNTTTTSNSGNNQSNKAKYVIIKNDTNNDIKIYYDGGTILLYPGKTLKRKCSFSEKIYKTEAVNSNNRGKFLFKLKGKCGQTINLSAY